MASAPGARESGRLVIARTPEAAEDLAANRIVPVAEGVANRTRPRGPGSAPKHLVRASKEGRRVFAVGKGRESRPRKEITRGPLPHVTDESVAAHRRDARRK